jgi:hypothetical protein
MASMKVRVSNPYKKLEEPMVLFDGELYKHTLNHTETVEIQHNEQTFHIYWDEERNALKILDLTNNRQICVFPSTANGILIKSVKQ